MKWIAIFFLLCASAFAGTVAEKLDDGIPASSSAITPTKGSLWIADGTCFFPFVIGANGTVLKADSAQTYGVAWGTVSGSGTVTSVALSGFNAGIYSTTGSPITGSGTLAVTMTGTQYGFPYFSTTSVLSSTAAGTTSQVLIGNAAGAPTWGTVTSAMITDGTIVNADVNTSAAIAGTKIAPDFGSQTVQTSGNMSATNFIGALLGNANSATALAVTSDTSSNNGFLVTFVNSTTGSQTFLADGNKFYYNPSTGQLNATTFVGALTGNASTATKLATARAINGVNFDGSAAITVTAAGSTLSDTATVAKGGTGVTSTTAYGLLAGGTTSTGAFQNTGTGTSAQLLISQGAGALPTWNTLGTDATISSAGALTIANLAVTNAKIANTTIDLTAKVTGALPTGNGGTGLTGFTQGDTFYASDATTITKLAKNTSATRVLTNTGTSNNPAWAQVTLTTGVTGTLPTANGGTGVTSLSSGTFTLSAQGSHVPTTSGATAAAQTESATNKVNYWHVDFADSATTYCQWQVQMPNDYDGGTVTAVFTWLSPTDTTTHSVKWQMDAVCMTDGAAVDSAWGTAQSVTDANASTANQVRQSNATGAITIGGSTPVAKCWTFFRAGRVGADGSDDLAAVASLLHVLVTYTKLP